MFFDPISTWLVVLIADGMLIADEKCKSKSVAEIDRNRVKRCNEMLNGDIRRIKNKYGLILAEEAYNQIKLHINVTKNSFSFQYAHGQIVIDIDNQEYIIQVLEACAERYSKYDNVEEYHKKAEWYKNAAIEARRKKEEYEQELEVTRVAEENRKEKERAMSNVYLVIGLAIFVAFIIFFFSA